MFDGCTGLKSIKVEAENPPSFLGSSPLEDVDRSAKIIVPAGKVAAYKVAYGWKDFANIVDNIDQYSLNDNDPYFYDISTPVQEFTYTRNFTVANKWQTLFVPFDIEITSEILSKCDIAMPYMVTTGGSIGGGTSEGLGEDILVLMKLKQGNIAKHGTAYFIRPKSVGEFRLEYSDITLSGYSDVNTLTCSTTLDDYAFVGQMVPGRPVPGTTWYAINADGDLQACDDDTRYLPAQRWYVVKTSKNGEPARAAANVIRIVTWGEDTGIDTGIDAINTDQKDELSSGEPQMIYTLSGQRINSLQKGINIINGKKVLVK